MQNLFCNEIVYYLLSFCTNPIFAKIFVPEMWAKMFSANRIAWFFSQPYLQKPYLDVDTNSQKLKVDQKVFWVGFIKNGFGQSCHGTLKLNVSQEWIDGMNYFFACWCTFRKLFQWFFGGCGHKWVLPFN